jgi:hypothetical protein
MPIALFHGYFNPGLNECLKQLKENYLLFGRSVEMPFPAYKKVFHNLVTRNGSIPYLLLQVDVIASIIKNIMGETTAEVFCAAGTIAIKLQQIVLEHGRASA